MKIKRAKKKSEFENLVPKGALLLSTFYDIAHIQWGLPPRTIQWYATEKIIPPPSRSGRNAYYEGDEIFDYLNVIEILIRDFRFSISEMRGVSQSLQKMGKIHNQTAVKRALSLLEGFQNYKTTLLREYPGPGKKFEEPVSQNVVKRFKLIKSGIAKGLKSNLLTILQSGFSEIEHKILKREKA